VPAHEKDLALDSNLFPRQFVFHFVTDIAGKDDARFAARNPQGHRIQI
jgi:hypothetical protein